MLCAPAAVQVCLPSPSLAIRFSVAAGRARVLNSWTCILTLYVWPSLRRRCVCLPLAWLLGFHLQLGVLGFWIALTLATAMQAAAFGVLISRFDWKAEVKRAAALTAAHQATH